MKEKLQEKLNKEYKDFGTITINDCHEEEVLISKIDYVKPIMNSISPLDNEEPIIIAKKGYYDDGYKIIDGYHRLKSKISKGDTSIKTIVLNSYYINRKEDTLFSFLEKLVGKNIKFIDSNSLVVDSEYYQIIENEGCGGCSSGWSSITVLPEYINKKIEIEKVESVGEDEQDEYELFINGKKVAYVDTGYGNGYYGGDFEIHLIK